MSFCPSVSIAHIIYSLVREALRVHILVFVAAIGCDVDMDTYGDPHLVAVLIKLFFRELPEPLMTFDLYQPILQISSK